MRLAMENKQMPKEVAAAVSNILKFLEKCENEFIVAVKQNADNIGQKEAKYENS